MGEPDGTFVARAQRGDADAFACLVQRHGPTLLRFCRRLAEADGVADDLAQETLLRAFRALPRLEDPARFEPWLLAIAANLARTWWRRQARWPLSLEALQLTYPDLPWDGLRSAVWSPDRIVEAAEEGQILRRALDSLPPAMGQAVALHYLGGLDYQEIAAALDVPVSTVRGRLFTSRRRLRAALLAAGWPEPAGRGRTAQPTKRTRRGHPMDTAATQTPVMDAPLEEVVVDSLRMNLMAPHNRVVMLKAKARERYLSIVIGVPESDAIAMKLQNVLVPRPMTHDLMLSGFEGLGARLVRVVVNDNQGETFYGQLHLERGGAITTLDARPSDCISLAVRAGAPIFVANAVMERCGWDSLATRSPANGEFALTERVQKVLALTRQEMSRFGRTELTSDLLLLGILAEGKSTTARVLAELGVQASNARTAVAALSGFGDGQPPADRLPEPANPAFRKLAEAAAQELGHRFIGTEHLLLAMLADDDGPARRALDHLGVDCATLRQRLVDAVRAQEDGARPQS